MPRELTTRLSRFPGLAVRAYASSKTMRGKSLREAGNALQVTSLLTQSLMRSGNRLRVTASLVDVKNDRVEWSETFEESDQDQFALQDKLVNAIAGALKLSLSPATQAKVLSRGTRNAQALDLVQRANFLVDQFTEPSLRQAVSLAELAIQKDSAYADAWAALVNAWGSLADDFLAPHEAIPEILRARARAVALDPSSAEVRAQARRAKTRAQLGDTQGARADLASAIAKSSKEYVREDAIAYTYFVLGDVEQSIQWWKRSVASHGSQVIYLAKDPLFASLRRDPRIQAMLRDAGVRPATIKA